MVVNDELREQLGRLDPMHPGVPVESAATPASQTRLEQIMNTPLTDDDLSDFASELPGESARSTRHTRPSRTLTIIGGVAAAAVVALGSLVVIRNINDDDHGKIAVGPPLELSLGASSASASCLVFDVAVLATMPTAFAGTATTVTDGTVTLAVDHWYKGGDASTVALHAASGTQALIDGFDFEVGQHYLISAAENQVNFCGFSGIATPELTTAFQTAFGS
jgi:hypothetical protein